MLECGRESLLTRSSLPRLVRTALLKELLYLDEQLKADQLLDQSVILSTMYILWVSGLHSISSIVSFTAISFNTTDGSSMMKSWTSLQRYRESSSQAHGPDYIIERK